MKRKNILVLAFCLNITYICFGQPPLARVRRVEDLQRTYLTKELSLTPEESNKFFPLYFQYRGELKTTRKERSSDEIEFAEEVLAVRKKYKTSFKAVLGTDERVNKIFQAERNFQKIIIEEVGKRKLREQRMSTGT